MRRALIVAGIGFLATGVWTSTATAQWRQGIGWQDFVPNVQVTPGGVQTQNRYYYDNGYSNRYSQWRSGEPRFYRNDQTFYPPPNSGNRYYYSPGYQQQPEMAPAPQDSARVRILVPDPEAAVWISGRKSHMMGPERVFQSPQLEPGKDYIYKVRVAWHDGDKFRTEEKDVNVKANETSTIAFGDAKQRQEMEAEYQNNTNQNRDQQKRMQDNQNANPSGQNASQSQENSAKESQKGATDRSNNQSDTLNSQPTTKGVDLSKEPSASNPK